MMLDLTSAFAAFTPLETKRLLLREITPADSDDMFRIMSDPLVARYFGRPPMASREAAERRVNGIAEAFADRSGVRWAITRREGGEFLGSCGFWRLIAEHHRAEIGYELAPAAWGQGIMPEAARAIIGFGFEVMGLHSVEAQIDPANRGSRRVLEKLGFVQEGYFRENFYTPAENLFTDTAVFSLLRSSWTGQGGAAPGMTT